MSKHQEARDAYTQWVDTYKPGEFIEYSAGELESLPGRVDARYVWTHHATCESERHTNGIQGYDSNCGCWQVFGWYICEVPWEEGAECLSIDVEWSGPCETCNEDGSDKGITVDCPECDGEGYTQDYFD